MIEWNLTMRIRYGISLPSNLIGANWVKNTRMCPRPCGARGVLTYPYLGNVEKFRRIKLIKIYKL